MQVQQPIQRRPRRGITVIDVILTLAIMGLLLSLFLPAVLSAQATARSIACQNQLRQWAVGLVAYEGVHKQFPDQGKGPAGGPFVGLLPFVDQRPMYESIDASWERTSPAFHEFGRQPFPLVYCPAETESQVRTNGSTKSSYCANSGSGPQTYGFNGLFRFSGNRTTDMLNARSGPVQVADVPDGLSNTAAFSEWRFSVLNGPEKPERLRAVWESPLNLSAPDQLEQFAELCRSVPANPTEYGWHVNGDLGGAWTASGPVGIWYNHVLTPNRPSCHVPFGIGLSFAIKTAGSLHRNGCYVAFADGHVDFFSNDVAAEVWSELGSRKPSDALIGYE